MARKPTLINPGHQTRLHLFRRRSAHQLTFEVNILIHQSGAGVDQIDDALILAQDSSEQYPAPSRS